MRYLFEQGIATLFKKSADQELVDQCHNELSYSNWNSSSTVMKGEVCRWLVQTSNFLVLESFALVAVHVALVTRSCKPPKKQMLFSVLQVFLNEKCYTFKGQTWEQSLENGLSCDHAYFRLQVTFFYKGSEPARQAPEQGTKVRAKGEDSVWSQGCFSLLQYYFSLAQNVTTLYFFLYYKTCTQELKL